MLRLIILVAMVSATALSASLLDLDREWAIYKKYYKKQYTAEEEPIRQMIWESNLKKVEEHNLEADRGLHSYELGMNHLADLTVKEVVKMMNGYKMSDNNTAGATYMAPNNMGDLPSQVDWRKKGYVTEVKNQGGCGSCWAFSATGAMEGQHFRKSGKLVSLSEQNLMDCSRPEGNLGCEGGEMIDAFRYIKKNHGVDTEKSYPYTAVDEHCHFSRANVGATLTSYTKIRKGNESALQSATATVGPIAVGIDASNLSFHMYKKGVYEEPDCSSTNLDHGVLVVGYGTEKGKDYWLVKNSWGTGWGINGYIKMSRNNNNNCGIASSASYPVM